MVELGLTSLQARVYLALAKLGPLKILEISKQSDVARTDVYRTLSRLHELSLVEQIIEAPIKFRAIPVREGIKSLLDLKTQHYEKLKKDSEKMLDAFNFTETEKRNLNTTENIFVLVPGKDAALNRQIQALEEANKSIDMVLSWNRFYRGRAVFELHVKKAIARSVHVRYVVQEPPTKKVRHLVLEHVPVGGYEIRFIQEKPKAIFGIYDQEKMMMLTNPLRDAPGESSSLWTNNPSLMAIVQQIFEILWKEAKN